MQYEKSCGAVVFTKIGTDIRYLLVSNLNGFYGFPKGHMESGETEAETALREIYEEANVNVELIDGFRKTDEYKNPQKDDTIKRVTYLLGEFRNQNVIWQSEELSGAYLVTYTEAMDLLQFESLKYILEEADNYINAKDVIEKG